MKSRILVVLAILCCVLALVFPASADDVYFNPAGTSTSWDEADNWHTGSCTGGAYGFVPQPDDEVIICANETCDFDVLNTTVLSVSVESGAVLNSVAGLTLAGAAAVNTSTIDGTMNVTGDLNLDPDTGNEFIHFFAGGGAIVGSSGATIKIQDNGQLSNSTTIRGRMVFTNLGTGNAFLDNTDGLIHADELNGTTTIEVQQLLDHIDGQGSRGTYLVTNDSTMVIDVVCNSGFLCGESCLVVSDFDVLEGVLAFQESLVTEGMLTIEAGGKVTVASGKKASFDLNGACSE